jgi:hypothetical protein
MPREPRVAPSVGSPEHARLVQLVRSRRELSKRQLSRFYPAWRKADRIYRHYVDPGEVDRDGKRLYPWARDVVVPLTFAIVQTQLSWEMTAFTQRTPIVPLDGVSPEDVKPAKVMEQVLQHEWTTDRMSLALYQWLLDRRRYGVGIVWLNWVRDATRQWVETPQSVTLPVLGMEIPLGTKGEWVDRVKYEGNRIEPVDPFAFYADPRVSLGECHKGEFVGYRKRRHYNELLLMQRDGQYANVEQIPKASGILGADTSSQTEREAIGRSDATLGQYMSQVGPNSYDFQDKGAVTLDVMVIRAIPKDYGIGPGASPEKAVVVLANDAVILRAKPFEYDHDELPACVMELTPDRYEYSTPGVVEHIEDLQDYLSWLWNSHAQNVRRTLNNQFLVDPSLVEIADLLQPQPGLFARLRREAQGRPGVMDAALKQFPVSDVTRTHMQDMDLVINMMQRVAAAPENLQGILAAGERTLGEQQLAVTSAQGRLRLEAQMGWLQGIVRSTHQRISNIQQFMDEDRWIQVVGTYPRALGMPVDQKFLKVGPDEIQGQFTYTQPDMVVRGDEKMLMAMREIFLAIAKDPELRQHFDIVKIFEPIAQLAGIKNIEDYTRETPIGGGQVPVPGMPAFGAPGVGGGAPPGQPTPQGPVRPRVLPDEEVERQVQNGNLVSA